MKLKPKDLIVCLWYDITSNDGWMQKEVAETMESKKCAVVGWFVSEDKNFLRLTSCVADDGSKNCVVIPKGCIQKTEVVNYHDFKF